MYLLYSAKETAGLYESKCKYITGATDVLLIRNTRWVGFYIATRKNTALKMAPKGSMSYEIKADTKRTAVVRAVSRRKKQKEKKKMCTVPTDGAQAVRRWENRIVWANRHRIYYEKSQGEKKSVRSGSVEQRNNVADRQATIVPRRHLQCSKQIRGQFSLQVAVL